MCLDAMEIAMSFYKTSFTILMPTLNEIAFTGFILENTRVELQYVEYVFHGTDHYKHRLILKPYILNVVPS